jgi:hypothetical protein
LKNPEGCVDWRIARQRQGGQKKQNKQIWSYKAHCFVRDQLEQDTILRRKRPGSALKQLEVSGQRSHLTMKFTLNAFWPSGVNKRARIKD